MPRPLTVRAIHCCSTLAVEVQDKEGAPLIISRELFNNGRRPFQDIKSCTNNLGGNPLEPPSLRHKACSALEYCEFTAL
jgi:hypothetical protein